jgi:hypothetical protein
MSINPTANLLKPLINKWKEKQTESKRYRTYFYKLYFDPFFPLHKIKMNPHIFHKQQISINDKIRYINEKKSVHTFESLCYEFKFNPRTTSPLLIDMLAVKHHYKYLFRNMKTGKIHFY